MDHVRQSNELWNPRLCMSSIINKIELWGVKSGNVSICLANSIIIMMGLLIENQ